MERVANRIGLSGEIVSDLVLDTDKYEKIYSFTLRCVRSSGVNDDLVCRLSEKCVDASVLEDLLQNGAGKHVSITGRISSYLKCIDDSVSERKNKLIITVFLKSLSVISEKEDTNQNWVHLDGIISKEPNFRITANGREVCDIMMMVNRGYGSKKDYVPCIAWNQDAWTLSRQPVGTKVNLLGRLQSREFTKRMDDGTSERNTVYEVSVHKFYIRSVE